MSQPYQPGVESQEIIPEEAKGKIAKQFTKVLKRAQITGKPIIEFLMEHIGSAVKSGEIEQLKSEYGLTFDIENYKTNKEIIVNQIKLDILQNLLLFLPTIAPIPPGLGSAQKVAEFILEKKKEIEEKLEQKIKEDEQAEIVDHQKKVNQWLMGSVQKLMIIIQKAAEKDPEVAAIASQNRLPAIPIDQQTKKIAQGALLTLKNVGAKGVLTTETTGKLPDISRELIDAQVKASKELLQLEKETDSIVFSNPIYENEGPPPSGGGNLEKTTIAFSNPIHEQEGGKTRKKSKKSKTRKKSKSRKKSKTRKKK